MIRSGFLALAVLAVVAGVAVGFWAAQRGRVALLPDPVPFSPVPDAYHWEFGFEAGPGQYLLELVSEDCSEAQALKEQFVKHAYPDVRRMPPGTMAIRIPFSRAVSLREGVPNPRFWTIVDMRGEARRVSFPYLAVLWEADEPSECYYLASESLWKGSDLPASIVTISDERLIVGLAGRGVGTPAVRRPAMARPEKEDPARLPRGYRDLLREPAIRAALGERNEQLRGHPPAVTGHPIDVNLGGNLQRLWLVYWSWRLSDGERQLWVVLRSTERGYDPVFVAPFGFAASYEGEFGFVPEFIAALDLDGDSWDEVIFRAQYSNGIFYPVFSFRGGNLTMIGGSRYWGE